VEEGQLCESRGEGLDLAAHLSEIGDGVAYVRITAVVSVNVSVSVSEMSRSLKKTLS